MRMILKVLPATFLLWCLLFPHSLSAVDLDIQFEDNQKQSHGSSIENSNNRDREDRYVYRSNILNSNSLSVPYSISEDKKSSLYENIKHSLSRLRENLYSLLSNSTTSPSLFVSNNIIEDSNVPTQSNLLHRIKREDNDSDEDIDQTERTDSNASTDPAVQENNVDDEDLTTGSGDLVGSGLPVVDEPTIPYPVSPPVFPDYGDSISPGTPRVYRLTIIIGEPYTSDYLYPHSAAFKLVEEGLAKGFNETLHDLPGHRTIIIQGIHRRPEDLFTCKVTLDLETINYYDNATLESRIRKQITDYHRIGSIQVWIDGFTFRDFRASSESCYPGEIQCRSNYLCIPSDNRCNGLPECSDASDENDCPKNETVTANCTKDEFMCDVTRCIPKSLHCNGVADCSDETDELSCDAKTPPIGCQFDEFACDSGKCILKSLKCDGRPDCENGSDEFGCPAATETFRYPYLNSRSNASSCNPDLHFICDNLICIPKSQRCDRTRDCQDGSDENNCTSTCFGGFQCVSDPSICLDSSVRCNRRTECPDGSDEHDCGCRQDEFKCHNGTCLNISKRCNNVTDCGSGEDERNCPHPTEYPRCDYDAYRCSNGQCVHQGARCDRVNDCTDGSDEDYCDPFLVPCPTSDFTCSDGSCVPLSKLCNGYPDCPDNDDEISCDNSYYTTDAAAVVCRSDEFACRNGRQCIPLRQQCDELPHCQDESDELECPRSTTYVYPTTTTSSYYPSRISCAWSKFACHDGLQCIPMSAHCNGNYDCRDYSDEQNCATNSEGIQLKVYPNDQIIKEGREVVIQCRDEGSTRTPVEWVRTDGAPLPPGSRNNRGRLEMPNISMRDSGAFLCRPVGYSPRNPAAQVKAYLTVEKWVDPTTQAPKTCSLNEATCSNGECIPKSDVCNGNYDCSDGSDETRCNTYGCEPNEYRCANRRCIQKTWRCDGDDDCLDHSDEKDCPTSPPGSPCSFTQFQCANRRQCIPKSFQCDIAVDCDDGSDEVGCSPVYIKTAPPPKVTLDIGATFIISCEALGVPTPLVSWRLNWNHIPTKCTTTSENGFGTLTCPDIQESDQGAYSCEAINIRGPVFATPDTILIVNRPHSLTYPCALGTFSPVAVSQRECTNCFCFGVTSDCLPSNLHTYTMLYPLQPFRLVNVYLSSDGSGFNVRRDQQSAFQPFLLAMGRNSFKISSSGLEPEVRQDIYPYFAFPDNYHGNQLKSYGGHLKYTVRYTAGDRELKTPEIILDGNGYTLTYRVPDDSLRQNTEFEVNAKLAPGYWYKLREPRGQTFTKLAPASREEIMMVLAGIEDILIKTIYTDGSEGETYISDIKLESSRSQDSGEGKAIYVEECRCPAGYTGLSCEDCAPGFIRKIQGPWKGQCRRDDIGCPVGTYGDISRNIPCQECPCPLTTPPNQFTRKCFLDYDNQPTCDCPVGYMGRRCEYCTSGYVGNPISAGDHCRPSSPVCDAEGSLSTLPDESGVCKCKELTTGLHCNQCKDNSFHLSGSNPRGCIKCFCSGVTQRCSSSNWYRSQVSSTFTRDVQDFNLVKYTEKDYPLNNLNINTNSRELIFYDFTLTSQDVYYWSLPTKYLGDKVTSYGGNLTYSVRHVPVPGGQSSKNNAVDVEIVGGDDLHLLYYSQTSVEPNQPITISAPMFEQFWQSSEGQRASREQILKTLSNIKNIFIKATYTTNTREAGLRFVSMDTAEDRNTGQKKAHEVEQCLCPQGYTGLSCELCDAGYTGHSSSRCEPCNCNGHSVDCDPVTGTCYNCQGFTTGERCEQCLPGYEGDPTRRIPCEPRNVRPCDCDPAGFSSCTENSQCICKVNVEGTRCDRCRYNTFDLSASHPEGCMQCFCSSVGKTCRSSNLYVTKIPILLIDDSHGFTLTDRNRQQTINSDFRIDVANNEISYDYSALRGQRLYWSLPMQFTGNRITSYGGKLTWTQQFTAGNDAINFDDTDVVISGNGISLYWDNVEKLTSNTVKTYSIPLIERGWRRISPNGVRDASRSDLLTVLSNVEAILIRASYASNTITTHLSDVSLDTAVTERTAQGRATQVELCTCPPGYKGTSCESCSEGFYRSYDNSCQKCPCNNNEISCGLAANNTVVCNCGPGYTGSRCHSIGSSVTNEPPTVVYPPKPSIQVFVRDPAIQIVALGGDVRFYCDARTVSPRPVLVKWSKEGSAMNSDHVVDDGLGQLIIRGASYSDSGVYVCTATDNFNIVTSRATLTVGNVPVTEAPRVQVYPRTLEVRIGEPAEFRCVAYGSPAPSLEWIKSPKALLNPDFRFENGVFRIERVQQSDEGNFYCRAVNDVGQDTQAVQLTVRRNTADIGTNTDVFLAVDPPEYTGPGGLQVILKCSAPYLPTTNNTIIKWSRKETGTLPAEARDINGVLTISNPSIRDSGLYICTARGPGGSIQATRESQVNIATNGGGQPPGTTPNYNSNYGVQVTPRNQTAAEGSQVTIECRTNDPAATIRWAKHNEEQLPQNMITTGETLIINSITKNDEGTYICSVQNPGGNEFQEYAIVQVEKREPPRIRLHPNNTQVFIVGDNAYIQCVVEAGDPPPSQRWSRPDHDGNFGPHVDIVPDLGLLRINNISHEDAGKYTCIAENSAGKEFINADIHVYTYPVVTINPSEQIVVQTGDSLNLECFAAGIPTPTVSWAKYIPPYDRNLARQELTETAVYNIRSVRPSDAGVYVCIGKNAAGSEDKRISVVVEPRGDYPTPSPRPGGDIPAGGDGEVPDVEEGEYVYAVGTTASFSCVTVNSEREIVEWTKDGQYISNNPPPNIQIVNERLWFNPVTENDAGEYACILKNANNEVMATSRKSVRVREPPRITLHPPKQTVKPNENAYIKCSAVGATPISIRWIPLRGYFPSHISEYNGELRFNGIKIDDEGKYTCIANNSVGTAKSTAEVIVTALGGDITQVVTAENDEITVYEGGNAELRCNTFYALGRNSVIKWSRTDGLPLQQYTEGNILRISNARLQDSGKYRCEVHRQNAIIGSDSVKLNVERISKTPELKIEQTSPTPGRAIMQGDSVDLECKPSINVNVTWTKLGGPIASNVLIFDKLLRVADVRLENSGYYECSAVISGITHSFQYNLLIENTPLYPNDAPAFNIVSKKEAPYGSKITLTCNNDLMTPVEYAWSKRSNGHVLPLGAFSRENTLTLQEIKNSDAGIYVCKVSNTDMTVEIPTVLLVTDSVPSFSQKPLSYLALPTLTDAHLHFSIEISFKPTDYNGLILYTGDSNVKPYKGKGDFISFGLEDGYPVFKFDVGSGAAQVRSNFSVELDEWHTVTLKRNRRKGMMFVDTMGPFVGESQGAFQGLDLSELVYIGGVPDFAEVQSAAGFSQGFKGCVSRLKYNRTEFELFKMAIERVGVDSCNTCKSSKHNACINNGLCQDAATKNGYTCICPPGFSGDRCAVLGEPCYPGACGDGSCQDVDGTLHCLCPIGTTGKKCEQKIKILQPAFKHGSYLAYPTPKTMRKFKVSLRLNPRDVRDGIILYSGQSDDGLGDFISLAIKDKHMEFRFDTGSGLVVLRSKVTLVSHEWVVVTIIKDFKEGKLSVAGEPLIIGSTPGEKLQVLNLRTPLYIGGFNIYHVTPSLSVEVTEGFQGCISTIDVLGSELDLINSAVDSANIMDCSDMESSPLCTKKPCLNYGICYPSDTSDRGYNCSCLSGYSGDHCEKETNACMAGDVCRNGGICKVTADSYQCLCSLGYAPPNCEKRVTLGSEIQFLGEGYVELKRDLLEERRSEESISFDFVTDRKNGLLLWHGQPSYKNGLSRNFVAVAVVNGYLEYSYDLGDGVVTIKFSKKRINDGIKHSVNITRMYKFGSLEVDNVTVGKGESPGSQELIKTPGNIYLGGTPNMDLMTGGRYIHPMSGLMMNIHIQNKHISSISNYALSGLHVIPWIRTQQEK